jgi:hypothetical protein
MPPPVALPALNALTFGYFVAGLSARLGSTFWTDAEQRLYLQEAFRTFNSAAAYFRERGDFKTIAATPFYDLATELPSLLGYTVTDRDLVTLIEYHLLEPPTPAAWTGTSMFDLAEITAALERRRNQFLLETGMVLKWYATNVMPPASGRIALQDSVIDVRRAAWKDADGAYSTLWRDDERNFNSYLPGWNTNPDTPQAYSLMTAPARVMQLAPIPADKGSLDLLVVAAGASLDPSAGVTLGVPDDFAWVLKWGALADLLGQDGPARDPGRSAYCERRWREGVALARLCTTVLQAEVDGQTVPICSVFDFDSGNAGWMNSSGTPSVLGLCAKDMIALADVPDGVHSVTMDVIRKAPVYTADNDPVTLGREEADAIIDYAQHLALFKCGGAEFEATLPHYDRLIRICAAFNEKLNADSANFKSLADTALRETKQRSRRESDLKLEPVVYENLQ